MIRLAVVAKAAGGAAALAPAFRIYDGPKCLIAYPDALGALDALAIVPDAVIDSFFEGRRHIGDTDRLLTGTSFDVDDDARWWSWGRVNDIPVSTFVDQASNYEARFSPSWGALFDPAPDKIAVIDNDMRDAVIALGADTQAVHAVGQPAFDVLHDVTPERRVAARARLGVGPTTLVALWIAEPPPPPRTAAEDKAIRGYTENETVLLAHRSVAACTGERLFLVRPHPVHAKLGGAPSPEAGDVRTDDGSKLDAFAAADVVLGQTSTALLEAWMLGLPVVSLQPDRRRPCPVTDGRDGLIIVTSSGAACAAIEAAIRRGRTSSRLPPKGAAARALLDVGLRPR